jgi:hypothetical protein
MILTYLTSASVIDGSRSLEETWAYVSRAFFRVWRLTSLVNPLTTVFAQRYLEPTLWMPVRFLFISFLREGSRPRASSSPSPASSWPLACKLPRIKCARKSLTRLAATTS